MEQHPIPQNISGFQFKLIGDITLKQFAYVAGGLILAYLATKITLVPSLLRWPIAGFFALLGFGLAFLPIEERPLDRWLTSFIKSIYSPTQYVWKKANPPPDILMSAVSPSTPSPSPAPTSPSPRIPAKTAQEFHTFVPPTIKQPSTTPPPPIFKTVPTPPPVSPATSAPPSPPSIKEDKLWQQGAPPAPPKMNIPTPTPPSPAKQVVYQEKKERVVTNKQAESQKIAKLTTQFQQKTASLTDRIASLQQELAAGTIAKERLFELQQLLGQLLVEKERMSSEVTKLRRQLEEKDKAPIERPIGYTKVDPLQKTTVRIVASPKALIKEGIPKLTITPNVITGIIKDSNGNLLPNLIVTVKDREGVPVRALKTNKLGQFAASTPLVSGVYVIEVEDPQNTFRFNRVEVTLTGQVMPALAVSAISEKDLMRQKLTHEIFGKNTL